MKATVGTFNEEKALKGVFSQIVKTLRISSAELGKLLLLVNILHVWGRLCSLFISFVDGRGFDCWYLRRILTLTAYNIDFGSS